MLDVPGVAQPGLEAVRLKQIERRFPVVTGRFHHHPGHAEFEQPVGHHLQRPGHRGVGRNLLHPLTGLTRDLHAAGQRRLADIQSGYPLDDVLIVLPGFQHLRLPVSVTRRASAEAAGTGTKLILLLEATVKGPQRGFQRPTNLRRQATKMPRRQRTPADPVSDRTGPPRQRPLLPTPDQGVTASHTSF